MFAANLGIQPKVADVCVPFIQLNYVEQITQWSPASISICLHWKDMTFGWFNRNQILQLPSLLSDSTNLV